MVEDEERLPALQQGVGVREDRAHPGLRLARGDLAPFLLLGNGLFSVIRLLLEWMRRGDGGVGGLGASARAFRRARCGQLNPGQRRFVKREIRRPGGRHCQVSRPL